NRGTAPVSLAGWSVQYASATGASWQVTALSGSLAPGATYLIGEAAGTGGTTALPSPDATRSIAMSRSAGKVLLAAATAALSCGRGCRAATGVRDFVGYGAANDFEGAAPVPALSATTAALRTGADTDNNSADFTTGAPAPRSGGGTPPPPATPIP